MLTYTQTVRIACVEVSDGKNDGKGNDPQKWSQGENN